VSKVTAITVGPFSIFLALLLLTLRMLLYDLVSNSVWTYLLIIMPP